MLSARMGAIICALALIACSPQPPASSDPAEAGGAQVGIDSPSLESENPAASPPVAAPATTPGMFSSGTFSARVEDVAIVKNCGNCVRGTLSMTLYNNGPAPISIIVLDDGRARLTLNGGVVLSTLGWQDGTELNHCRSDVLSECWTRQSSEYTQIEPGSSLTVSFRVGGGSISSGELATIPEVRTGSFATRLHIVESGGVDHAVNMSFRDLTVTNNAS